MFSILEIEVSHVLETENSWKQRVKFHPQSSEMLQNGVPTANDNITSFLGQLEDRLINTCLLLDTYINKIYTHLQGHCRELPTVFIHCVKGLV